MIAVVHLVWGPFGTSPLRGFLASYREHVAGVEHELVVLFNGIDSAQRPEFEAELVGLEHRVIELEEPVQDLAAYAQVAARLQHERVCFLNSYSQLLAPNWLAKLNGGLDQPRAGIAGATGSWASLRSGVLNSLFLPNPYRGVVPGRAVAREQFITMNREIEDLGARTGHPSADTSDADDLAQRPASRRTLASSVVATLKTLPPMPEQLLRFDGFPAEHLRTNGFMIERCLFAELQFGSLKRKMDAYRLESGRNSITRQLQRRGLRTLVVDREGDAYEPERWHLSNTFWQADQERLLVADNQTRLYANGGLERRELLSAFAWGRLARPLAPGSGDRHG